jgi:hypothetical protein
MRLCKRCGGDVSWTHDTVTLIGGVTCHLCNACRTDFHGWLLAQPIADESDRLKAHGAALESREQTSEAAWEAHFAAVLELERRIHPLVRAWVETPKVPPFAAMTSGAMTHAR